MTRSESAAIYLKTEAEPFDVFFRREYQPVLGLAIALSRDRWIAEDLTQEAFTNAERKWSQVGGFDHPEAWVRRVVANKSVSRWRRTQAEARALRRIPARGNPSPDPQLSIEAVEVWAAVRSLPKRQAQVLALTYLEGLSTREVAEVLGCSVATVKTHLQRGRTALAHRLNLEEER